MTEIDIKTLHKMINEIVKEEIDNHRHRCIAARDADFLERSITPSKIRISEYNEYKDSYNKTKAIERAKKAKRYKEIMKIIGFIILFICSFFGAMLWRKFGG